MGRQPGNAVALVGWGLGIKWVNYLVLGAMKNVFPIYLLAVQYYIQFMQFDDMLHFTSVTILLRDYQSSLLQFL